jgi:hypothetical protein
MGDRFLASLKTMASVVVVALLWPVSATAGQAREAGPAAKTTAVPRAWTAPLTPDGQPDLQGVWLVNTATPLERPKALEGRQFLTDEEVAELRNRADRIFKDLDSDFAAGDGVFLSALANLDRSYRNPAGTRSTENSVGMIEREFDNRTSLVVDPADGRIPPLTPAAQQRQAAARRAAQRPPAGPEDLANSYRCITTGVPKLGGLYGAGHFSYYQIFQTHEYVALATETIHDVRIIPLNGRPHLPESVRQWNGDSRGRWEGSTLVVDTTNFSGNSNFMGSTDNLHLIERFTRVAPDTIHYELTITDPTTWTKPWTALMPMKGRSERIHEFACHEGNLMLMYGMFAAARADEKVAEDAAKKGVK